jgi:colanic acid biosynthesis glycosyl transferase WcaI
MRILVVTQYFWPESFIVNGMVSELVKRGHEVDVLTGLPNYPQGSLFKGYSLFFGPWKEKHEGSSVLRSFLIPRGRGFISLFFNYVSFVVGGCIRALFLKKKYDLIFCFSLSPITSSLPGLFLRWKQKIPLLIWVQDLWPESVTAVGPVKSEKITQLVGALVKFIYKRCDLIIMQSEAFKPSILKWGGRENKLAYLPNWAEPFSEKTEIPDWIKDLPRGFRIGFAGNIGKAQSLKTLIAAAEILKSHTDIYWVIVGEGSEKKDLDQAIIEKKLMTNVVTIGRKPYSDMQAFFNSCDSLLVSLTDESIFSLTIPSKVQAYMAAGRPIIASLNGEGAKLIEQSGAGMACKAENSQQLADVVLKLKSMSSSERELMGKNSYACYSQNFEKTKVIDQLEILLKSAGA